MGHAASPPHWAGLSALECDAAAQLLEAVRQGSLRAPQAWQQLARDVLRPDVPFETHQALHAAAFAGWDERVLGPPPVWVPAQADIAGTNLLSFMGRFTGDLAWTAQRTGHAAADWRLLQRVSVANPEGFWSAVLRELEVPFDTPPARVLREGVPGDPDSCEWLPGARLNIAAAAISTPRAPPGAPAVLWAPEGAPRDLRTLSRGELRERAYRVASCVAARWPPGTPLAINMPMTLEAVVIYLGIVLAGCSVVSIADSFSGPEISSRLRISRAAAIFTQDVVPRAGRALPLYARLAEGGAPHTPAVVLPAAGPGAPLAVALRGGDVEWGAFLGGPGGGAREAAAFAPRVCGAQDITNMLFSSGTTGEPKAIPWTHVTPLRCAADAWAHQDVRPGSVVAWPTNLGWMMGPWLVYAALLNGGTIALYQGAPLGRDFGEFVESAGVEVLGLVPSITKAWRATGCMAGLDWAGLRCFSSTGEASAPEDYHWLAARVRGYRPVIEYCGGTEIGGAFLTGCLLQPQAASAFSTPSLGASLVLLGPDGEQSPDAGGGPFVGELALVPPMLGTSQRLLNRDHAATYYAGMPRAAARGGPGGVGGGGRPLRRHGDEVERLAGGYYRALGRCDDTMNLGGIKVSSVELERAVVERLGQWVLEAAAVGVPAPGGGPEQLHLFLVLTPAGAAAAPAELHAAAAAAVRSGLNPLFKVERVAAVGALPRTASNKVMRRVLRDQAAPPPRAKL